MRSQKVWLGGGSPGKRRPPFRWWFLWLTGGGVTQCECGTVILNMSYTPVVRFNIILRRSSRKKRAAEPYVHV